MYNLKRCNGTFKGNIGECLFKLTKRNLFLTRFHSKYKVLNIISKFLTREQKDFLNSNWYSIDGIELVNDVLTIYEIKTRNRYKTPLKYKPKTTSYTISLYSKAIKIGFIVKTVFVWLEEDWNFSLEIKDFNSRSFCEDKAKIYDKL